MRSQERNFAPQGALHTGAIVRCAHRSEISHLKERLFDALPGAKFRTSGSAAHGSDCAMRSQERSFALYCALHAGAIVRCAARSENALAECERNAPIIFTYLFERKYFLMSRVTKVYIT